VLLRVVVTGLAVALAAAACGGNDQKETTAAQQPAEVDDPGPVHVHGLGINPRDRALFIATHTGLFRAVEGGSRAERVADRYQDTMGFTVVGPDRFLGSGHPDGRENLPPFLGLIRSEDAGETWKPVSLQGQADFHVLEAAGRRVYGFGADFETRRSQFLVSRDGGRTWQQGEAPEPLISLAIDTASPARLLASSEHNLWRSEDGGRRWRAVAGPSGLVAQLGSRSYVVSADGEVSAGDGGRRFRRLGEIGGQPSAFEAAEGELYAALHDGTIKRSSDGESWAVRLPAPAGDG